MRESVAEIGDPAQALAELLIGGKTAAEWEIIRSEYEDGPLTIVELCSKYDTYKSAIRRASIVFKWRLRQPRRIDRTDIIERLFRLLDSQITDLEEDMERAGRGEVAVLGRLVNTLDKLIDIRNAETARRHPPRSTRHISDIKAKLIERIEQLKRA